MSILTGQSLQQHCFKECEMTHKRSWITTTIFTKY